jgi:hypothetical protein
MSTNSQIAFAPLGKTVVNPAAALAAQIETQKNPVTATGVPWSTP